MFESLNGGVPASDVTILFGLLIELDRRNVRPKNGGNLVQGRAVKNRGVMGEEKQSVERPLG